MLSIVKIENEKYQCIGTTTKESNLESFLRSYYDMDPEELIKIGQNGSNFVVTYYGSDESYRYTDEFILVDLVEPNVARFSNNIDIENEHENPEKKVYDYLKRYQKKKERNEYWITKNEKN